ncbi:MAG: hypothetical protein Q8K75_11120 [Chlamydiales bacterium]|nr:hypothetical protein [Chlamydiales bacterium]
MGNIAPRSLSRGSGERPYPDISYAAVRLECFLALFPTFERRCASFFTWGYHTYIASRLAAKHFSYTPQSQREAQIIYN